MKNTKTQNISEKLNEKKVIETMQSFSRPCTEKNKVVFIDGYWRCPKCGLVVNMWAAKCKCNTKLNWNEAAI